MSERRKEKMSAWKRRPRCRQGQRKKLGKLTVAQKRVLLVARFMTQRQEKRQAR